MARQRWVRQALYARNYTSAPVLALKAIRHDPLSAGPWLCMGLALTGPLGHWFLRARRDRHGGSQNSDAVLELGRIG